MKLEAGVSVMPERHLLLLEEEEDGAEGAEEPPCDTTMQTSRWSMTHTVTLGSVVHM
jgi:hypothetical protein